METAIEHLIINSAYEEPKYHWKYDPETQTFTQETGRRRAGYTIASNKIQSADDLGKFIEIPLVNQIRPRVKAWRLANYPGVSGMTKRLLEHWQNLEERLNNRFFFCQLEAIETMIWLTEAPPSDRLGIEIPSDGSLFKRICCKMATGCGKTLVMAMLIAWQILNKLSSPQDTRFSKYILVIAPGLTVKTRLEVLLPYHAGNYYQAFNIIPLGLSDKLLQGKILIQNWHVLNWETESQLAKKKTVDKRGLKSNEAYVRQVLGELARCRNILVINDEAHHAWRLQSSSKIRGLRKDEIEQATKWIGGCDRIHQSRGILTCFDFSATPFTPSAKTSNGEKLFNWVVSDFGLNDAIESGLVKTPRVIIRDDGQLTKEYKSRLYHLYKDPEVKDDINRKASPEEPLPNLVINGYHLLGKDWLETAKAWKAAGFQTPPVMITVANRIETSARIKYAFDCQQINIPELSIPELTLQVDSKALEAAESQSEATLSQSHTATEELPKKTKSRRKKSKKERGELLRQIVDTVGQAGQAGEGIQKVISVGMLSEGWDAKTVTHIMGLRAFSSQLLCEQVVGRGLRRTAYEVNPETGLLEPEYVNIFGVPFTFLPHESTKDTVPPPSTPKTQIKAVGDKRQYEIKWPNIIRIDRIYQSLLKLDISQIEPLELEIYETPTLAELVSVLDRKADITNTGEIESQELVSQWRRQRIIFESAREIFRELKPDWKSKKELLLSQAIAIIEEFIKSEKILISPPLFYRDETNQSWLITLNMKKIARHILTAVKVENIETVVPVFDRDRPIRSTGDMPIWYTGKPCQYTQKSHINCCAIDGSWETSAAFEIDRHPHVDAWVKNDRLGFEVFYIFKGKVRKYRPNFLIRLKNGNFLILDTTNSQESQQDVIKRKSLDEWVMAVNRYRCFGKWLFAVSKNSANIVEIIEKSVLL